MEFYVGQSGIAADIVTSAFFLQQISTNVLETASLFFLSRSVRLAKSEVSNPVLSRAMAFTPIYGSTLEFIFYIHVTASKLD